MAATPLNIGQPNFNIHQLETFPLTKGSSRTVIMPQKVLDLLNANEELSPGWFESLRAKTIAIVIGGVLPLIVTALFCAAIYGAYQYGLLTTFLQNASTTITTLAQEAFAAMNTSSATLAASAGGALTLGYILTRPAVSSAIGSFFGSLFGTFTGAGLFDLFKKMQGLGYNWWYDKYRFPERLDQIKQNQETIVTVLKDTYDDMAKALRQNQTPEQRLRILVLKDSLPIIRAIMVKQGITENSIQEITLEFEKAIWSAFDMNNGV